MTNQLTFYINTTEGWERSLLAFLAEKERRSGSRRTVEGYSRMLQPSCLSCSVAAGQA